MVNQIKLNLVTYSDRWRGNPSAVVAHRYKHHMYETALAYIEAGLLERFITSRFVGESARQSRLFNLFPEHLREKLFRYSDGRIEPYTSLYTTNYPTKLSLSALGNHNVAIGKEDFIEYVGNYCVTNSAALHTHPTGAVEAFRVLKPEGLPCILEQYVADYDWSATILREECARLGIVDVPGELASAGYSSYLMDRFREERDLADIFMCPSDIVVESLQSQGVRSEKIRLATYGIAPDNIAEFANSRAPNEPLRIAFVGTGALRKGLHHLLDAILNLRSLPTELHVFGRPAFPDWLSPRIAGLGDRIKIHGFMPKSSLTRELRRCHVGVLPSLVEGSAIAIMDYLSQGLPCIVTPNAGSCITDGLEGFIVAVSDSSSIAARINYLWNEMNRREMAEAALSLSRIRTWAAYRKETISAYMTITASH